MNEKKIIYAVKFMRKRREELSRLHIENPNEYQEQFKRTYQKYEGKFFVSNELTVK